MFSPSGMKVLEARYLCRDNAGKIIQTPERLLLSGIFLLKRQEGVATDRVAEIF